MDGANYTYTIQGGANNSGPANATRAYNWTVNDTITSAFKVMIQDANASRSDISVTSPFNSKIVGYFNLTYPNGGGGQNFTVNDNITIAWGKAGSVSNAKLEIAKNDDWINATTINASTPNTGVYTGYLVHDMISDFVKIRVSDATDPQANDTSNDYFKIHGAINLTAPIAGNRLPIGYNSTIRWNTAGNITKVDIISYSSLGVNDSRFPYTLSNPYNISLNYTNRGNNETTYNWTVPDNATNNLILRVKDSNDNTIYDENAGNLSIIGSFDIVSPNGNEIWMVNDTHNITWFPTGSSITEAKIMYSSNNGSSWAGIQENYNISNDGIVNNTGNVTNNWLWTVPDAISNNTLIKIEDRFDETVNDTSNATFKIRGNFSFNSPIGGERWVTYENRTISWNTTGSIAKVNIYYSRDNFTNNQTIVLNRTNSPGVNNFLWSIPDPVSVFTINSTALPVSVKMRIENANDSTVYVDSNGFNLDYYNITWYVRDFLSNLQVATGLSVNDTSGWFTSELASPVAHKTPYGSWQTTWKHNDYGDATEQYIADVNKNITVYLESKVVHVWEAKTEYVYDVANDTLTFQSYLSRDGLMAGARDENGTFYTIADNCSIEVYYPNGTWINTFNTSNVTGAGFFKIDWNNTSLNTAIVYNAITQIDTLIGGKFRTPFAINLVPTVSTYEVKEAVAGMVATVNSVLDKPVSEMSQEIQAMIGTGLIEQMEMISAQTTVIEQKMIEQTTLIQTATDNMETVIQDAMVSFETTVQESVTLLKSSAETAEEAAGLLETTAKKYSWNAMVSPDPALTGDMITLTCQGQPGLSPILDIYSWDNKAILDDIFLTETTPGVYTYEFKADQRFTAGKAYTYVITEQTTSGMVAGSGMVESMGLTTVAGLAAAAPGAERAAKKALDAIKAIEAVLISKEPINIALTLKNLKESVDALPEVFTKEGPSTRLTQTVNEISDRLKKLGGEEGYDLNTLLEEAISESPTMKDMRGKTDAINSVVDILMQIFEAKFGGIDTPIISTSLQPGSVKFRIVAVNPSKFKTQKVEVRNYLPVEVKPKDVLDTGGLDLEYDSERSIYYMYKPELVLSSGEVRVFEVEVEDVWVIQEKKLDSLKERTDTILAKLQKTEYYERAKETADTIYPRLDEIAISQKDESVSREKHIGIYRQNLLTLEQIKEDIARMEKILVTAGGPAAPEMLAKTRIKAEEPTKTMTWIVIFIIIIFTGLLAGVLFFTWHRQARLAKEDLLAAKKSAFPEAGSKEEKENKEKDQ